MREHIRKVQSSNCSQTASGNKRKRETPMPADDEVHDLYAYNLNADTPLTTEVTHIVVTDSVTVRLPSLGLHRAHVGGTSD